ncbi:DUF805 domain-containing protein [Paeniglutamicibacter sp. MACA_103]|uniref:DUF805 domain-containing protein n=1 Tax=Paeniglutamicibacter sp. MACA_103 TaxID=3377337 RepID=UPI0038965015
MSYPGHPTENPYATPTENSLELPRYGAKFGEAIQRFFKKYATFSGRASRSEYWWVALLSFLVSIIGQIAMTAGGAATADPYTQEPGSGMIPGLVIVIIYGLATLVPSIAVSVRRLHDGNFSGWLYLLVLIPVLGGLAIFVLMLLPSNPAGVRFDKAQAWSAAQPTA